MKRIALFFGLSTGGLLVSAQTWTTTARAEPIFWLPRVVYRPLIKDSTLLLLSPDLVWRCEQDGYWGGGTYFEVDFEHVVSCEGRKEVYELVRGHGDYYDYRMISRALQARLARTSDTTFLYTEMAANDTAKVVRSVPLVMDLTKTVYVDSSYTEDLQSGEMRLRVSKFVELRAK